MAIGTEALLEFLELPDLLLLTAALDPRAPAGGLPPLDRAPVRLVIPLSDARARADESCFSFAPDLPDFFLECMILQGCTRGPSFN